MATIERRKLKNGSAVRYRVKWRTGGTGAWDGETFDAYADGKRWKGLVESTEHQRPGLDQLRAFGFTDRARGVDLLDAAPVAAPAVPPAVADPSPEALAPLLAEYAEQVIEDLDHVLGYTKRRYRGLLRRHVAPYFQDKRVDEPKFTDLQRWQRAMVASGLSRKTIANIRGSVLVPVLKAACKPGRDGTPPWRHSNPLDGLRLPVGRTRRRGPGRPSAAGCSRRPAASGRLRHTCTRPASLPLTWPARHAVTIRDGDRTERPVSFDVQLRRCGSSVLDYRLGRCAWLMAERNASSRSTEAI